MLSARAGTTSGVHVGQGYQENHAVVYCGLVTVSGRRITGRGQNVVCKDHNWWPHRPYNLAIQLAEIALCTWVNPTVHRHYYQRKCSHYHPDFEFVLIVGEEIEAG